MASLFIDFVTYDLFIDSPQNSTASIHSHATKQSYITAVQKMQGNGYDYLAKLLIIGDSGVGKTNILLRFCDGHFVNSHLTTIGIDFKIKTITIDEKKVRMQIWDTAGQEKFKTITQTYYRGAMGIIMAYAVDDRASFEAMAGWLRQVKQHACEQVCKVLVANKVDCERRRVSKEEGEKLAGEFGVNYFEVSAKQNLNVHELFEDMGRQVRSKLEGGQLLALSSTRAIKGKKLDGKGADEKKKKKCCG